MKFLITTLLILSANLVSANNDVVYKCKCSTEIKVGSQVSPFSMSIDPSMPISQAIENCSIQAEEKMSRIIWARDLGFVAPLGFSIPKIECSDNN